MTALSKLKSIIKSKKGSMAIEFIGTATMLILTFAMLVSAMIYITQYYNASYICRTVVRQIEIAGKCDAAMQQEWLSEYNDVFEDLSIEVDKTGNIQLLEEFTVSLTAKYPINIAQIGDNPIPISLPIEISLTGRSEVYHK